MSQSSTLNKPAVFQPIPSTDVQTQVHTKFRIGRRLSVSKSIVTTLLIAIVALFIGVKPPLGLTLAGWNALGLFVASSYLWATGLVSPAKTGGLLLLALLLLQLSSPVELATQLVSQTVLFLVFAFMIGAAIQSVGLSDRVASRVLHQFGTTPRRLVISIFLVSLFSSYIIQEHVVVAVLFPLMLNFAGAIRQQAPTSRFPTLLLIAMAWGGIVGGVGTYLGGGRALLANALLTGYTTHGLSFWQWAAVGVPFSLLLGGIVLLVLFRFFPIDIDRDLLVNHVFVDRAKYHTPMQPACRRVAIIFGVLVFLWATLSTVVGPEKIALLGVVLILLTRSVSVSSLVRGVHWQIVLVYGGAIALGAALTQTQVSAWLGVHLLQVTAHLSPKFILATISGLSLLHTELIMSNATTVSSLLPMTLPLSSHALSPQIITFAITLASGLAFVLPMSTPAMAIILSTEYVHLKDLLAPGLLLKLLAWAGLLGYLLWLR